MRKLVTIFAILFGFSFWAVPAATAGTVNLALSNTGTDTTFTISGIYATGTPTFSNFSAAGQAYSLSFTVLTDGSANAGFTPYPAFGIFFVNADMTLSFGGSTYNLGTLQFEFDNTLNGNMGGLFFCVDTPGSCGTNTYWVIAGQQLFSGGVSTPTFGIPGLTKGATMNAYVNESPTVTGYEIHGAGPFPFGTPTPTPEPASLFLLGTGLLGLGIITRRKLRLN
ncbi:MAG TPA: PEP-CTERM sorting domain-containing protein [Candidatus Acidoferrales bacterium]|nr:PEP-CTERM sorting domain-containing protein [Candidatus Acidoferrales bacterium]